MIFGGSRQPFSDEEDTWKEIASNLNCHEDVEICSETLSHFRRVTHFIQIRSEEDYIILRQRIKDLYAVKNLKEAGRVFYFAIPPSGYQEVSRNIHLHSRPETGTWLRVVLEKPFGDDLESAKLLANEISKYFREDEIYRVDHYLGKFGVEQILPFRRENSIWLTPIWNKESIQFVEIAMKERLDVKGRSKFYDSYGVIRDVLQNHLTEILVRLLVPTHRTNPLTSEQFVKAKMNVLSKLYPPMLRHSLLGQYTEYQKHLWEDGVQHSIDGNSNTSTTPTFASVALYLRDPQWHRVPLILMSGKQLDQRTAYARVAFKQRQFHIGRTSSNCSLCHSEIIFLIQDEQFPSPGILISEQLSSQLDLVYPSVESVSWIRETTTYHEASDGLCKYTYIHPSQAVEANAYVSVIRAVLEGKQEHFVDTESLLLSWKVWSPLLHEIELSKHSLDLRMYSPDKLDALDYELKGTNMFPRGGTSTTLIDVDHNPVSLVGAAVSVDNTSTIWTGLLGHRTTVSQTYSLSLSVAEDLLRAARESVEQSGEFHLALPGGQSPVFLMNLLSLDYYRLFPWQQTHIWQTDERCVKGTLSDSNWNQISEYLLSVVPIPFHHLHPMPTDLQNGICNDTDNGDALYHRALSDLLIDDRLDYVVLGVGADGHIASLFPEAATLTTSTSDDLVKMVELKDSYTVKIKKRMTLSLDAVLSAESILVIVTGAEKATLLERVVECLKLEMLCDLSLVRLMRSATLGQLALYIDSELV